MYARPAAVSPGGIRHAPSGVNSAAKRSQSRINAASVNSARSASISTRSAMA
jgi:hypothetical protein